MAQDGASRLWPCGPAAVFLGRQNFAAAKNLLAHHAILCILPACLGSKLTIKRNQIDLLTWNLKQTLQLLVWP
jgi:hypothetical protein